MKWIRHYKQLSCLLGALALFCLLGFTTLGRPQSPNNSLTITSIQPQGHNVVLQWQGASGPYRVQFKTNTSGPWVDLSPDLSTTAFTSSVPSGFAMFRVRTVSDPDAPVIETTLPSAGADTNAPSVPTSLAVSQLACDRLTLSWSPSTDNAGGVGLKGYQLYRNGTFYRLIQAPATSTVETGLVALTTVRYLIKAIDLANNQSAGSSILTVTVPPCPETQPPSVPANLIAPARFCDRVNLTWSPSTDAGGSGLRSYLIYRNSTLILQVPADSTNVWDTTVAPLTTYSYTIAAVDYCTNRSALSVALPVATPACTDTNAPSVPTGLAASQLTCTRYTLSWNPATDNAGGAGIKGYQLYRDATFYRLIEAPATSTIETGLVARTTHKYLIKAIDWANNQSAASPVITVITPPCAETEPPSVPGNFTASTRQCDRVQLSWSPSTDTGGSGLTGYQIYRYNSLILQVPAGTTNVWDTSVAPLTTYTYTIAAIDYYTNRSALSSAVTVSTPACKDTNAPAVPSALAASQLACNRCTLSWNPSTDNAGGVGVKAYQLYRNGTFYRLIEAPATSTLETGLVARTTTKYLIKALDWANNQSAGSPVVTVTTPPCPETTAPSTPGNFSASTRQCDRVQLSWSPSTDTGGSGLTGYQIYRNNALVLQVPASITNTWDTSVQPLTTYSYTIAAVDYYTNRSAQSSAVTVSTPACTDTNAPAIPGGLAIAQKTCQGYTFSWNPVTDSAGGVGLKGYQIYRDGIFYQFVAAPATSLVETGLVSGITHKYLLKAIDWANNQSGGSTQIWATAWCDTAAPTVPAAPAATALACDLIRLSWQPSTDTGDSTLRGYRIYRNGVFLTQVLAPSTTLTNSGLAATTTYTYRISAVDRAGNESAQSTAVSATTGTCSGSSPTVTLAWDANPEPDVAGYIIYSREMGGTYTPALTVTNGTTATLTDLRRGTTYFFVATAYNISGLESDYSNEVTCIIP